MWLLCSASPAPSLLLASTKHPEGATNFPSAPQFSYTTCRSYLCESYPFVQFPGHLLIDYKPAGEGQKGDGSMLAYSPYTMASSLHGNPCLLLHASSMAQTLTLAVISSGPSPAFLPANRAHWIPAYVLPVSTENNIQDVCEAPYTLLHFPKFSSKGLAGIYQRYTSRRRRKRREEKHAIARKFTKPIKLHQLIWSQHYLAPTEQTLGPAQNNPIAQLQTIPATVYSCKYLQTKSKILQFYEWRPQMSNHFTFFFVYTCLNANYGYCYFSFSLCEVQLSFPSQQKGRIQHLKYYPKFISKMT